MGRREPYHIAREAALLRKRLDAVIRAASELEDARFVAESNRTQVRKVLGDYTQDLDNLLHNFFTGAPMESLSARSLRTTYKDMREFPELGKITETQVAEDRLLRAARNEYGPLIRGVVSNISQSQNRRVNAYKLQVDAQSLPAELFEKRFGQVPSWKIVDAEGNSKLIRPKNANATFEAMSRVYGRSDKVVYRDGTNYPLRTYVDQKIISTSREVQDTATILEGSSRGIMTGRVTSHGSADSCIFHEGEMIFLSEGAREQFLRDPDLVEKYPEAKSWRTYGELQRNKTHIFVFGCKHRVKVQPIHLLEREDINPNFLRKPVKLPSGNLEKEALKFREEKLAG